MNNAELKQLKTHIHPDLKAIQKGKSLVVKEADAKSVIKEIHFNFHNQDDVLIIQQNGNKCLAINNLFEKKILESCDFIVLLCKKSQYHLFFCEIKNSNNKENCQKAIKQIEGSKIFIEYLFKSYSHCYDKELKIEDCHFKHFLIYPSAISQKSSVTARYNLHPIRIPCDEKGFFCVSDGYSFFN